MLLRADAFERERHEGQTRRGSETPYWLHPVRVAMGLMRWGVTDRDVLAAALLAQLGCGHVQGWVIAKPMPVEELVGWLTAHRERRAQALRIGIRAR